MEKGYLYLHDVGEQFDTLPMSLLYPEKSDEDSDNQYLDIESDSLGYVSHNLDGAGVLWDVDQGFDSDLHLPLVPLELTQPQERLESVSKEDFQKTLLDWQDHLGSLRAADSDEMGMGEIVSLDMNVSEKPPEDIFETSARNRSRKGLSVSEPDDECIDVETVTEQIPVLEAGDVTTLLEQFEASEAANVATKLKTVSELSPMPMPLTHQNIKDALPKEIIEKIKASARKKVVPLIPAMPSKRVARGTRMQDAGASLSRNKLLKIVSGGSTAGETVQLDHDYCSFDVAPPAFYHSDASEYTAVGTNGSSSSRNSPTRDVGKQDVYVRLPEYYLTLAPRATAPLDKPDRAWDSSSSKKDSGLESGEVSDDATSEGQSTTSVAASVSSGCYDKLPSYVKDVVHRGKTVAQSETDTSVRGSVDSKSEVGQTVSVNSGDISKVIVSVRNIRSILKSNCVISDTSGNVTNQSASSVATVNPPVTDQELTEADKVSEVSKVCDVPRPKRKLNLEEYRHRQKELERFRSTESSRASTPVASKGSSEKQCVEVQTEHKASKETPTESKKRKEDRDSTRLKSREYSRDTRHWRRRSRRSPSSSSYSSCGSHVSSRRPRQRHCSRRRVRRYSSRSRDRKIRSFWSRSRSPSGHHTSPSSDRSRSSYTSRSRSRSHSKSRTRSRSRLRSGGYRRRGYRPGSVSSRSSRSSFSGNSFRRSPPPLPRDPEKLRQVEERRVIYVGRLLEGTTKAELRKLFEQFGPVVDISVHFRERGDNYGFVTFENKNDAYEAVEHGHEEPLLAKYDLCFGGRRAFCKVQYSDLDGMTHNSEFGPTNHKNPQRRDVDLDFDSLLRQAKATMRHRNV